MKFSFKLGKKNKIIISIVVVLLIVLIGVGYYVSTSGKDKTPNTTPNVIDTPKQTDTTQPGTTSTVEEEDNDSLYIKDKKVGSHLWFSGNEWMVLKKDDEGIYLISINPISILNYNLENNNSYNLSYLRNWLNGKYYNTLNNKELLKTQTNTWRTKEDGTKEVVTDNVGLLTKEDYVKYKDILKLSKYNWTMSAPSYSTNQAYYIANNGNLDITQVNSLYGVSPIIKIDNSVSIKSGMGTKDVPYKLAQETIATPGSMLNTRHTGEYILYAGLIWRVVEANQDKTTKILYNNVVFHSGFDTRNLPVYYIEDTNNIANYLNSTFYGNLANNNWIVPSNWYLKDFGYTVPVAKEEMGTSRPGNGGLGYSYTNNADDNYELEKTRSERSKIESLSAYVGLLKVGDLLTTTDINADWWLITQPNNSTTKVYYVYYLSGIISQADAITSKIPARPAVNLDSRVYITGGEGTLDNPYTLSR